MPNSFKRIFLHLFFCLLIITLAYSTHQEDVKNKKSITQNDDNKDSNNEPIEVEITESNHTSIQSDYGRPTLSKKMKKRLKKRRQRQRRLRRLRRRKKYQNAPTASPIPTSSPSPDLCDIKATLPCMYAETKEDTLTDLLSTDNKGTLNQTEQDSWWGIDKRSAQSVFAANFLKDSICREIIDKVGTVNPRSQPTLKRLRRTTHNCREKNSGSSPGTLRICGECSVVSDLGPQWSPRYINEIVCDTQDSSYCFGSEGTCVQNSITILVEMQMFGVASFASYNMRTGCSCELFPGSVLLDLNI